MNVINVEEARKETEMFDAYNPSFKKQEKVEKYQCFKADILRHDFAPG